MTKRQKLLEKLLTGSKNVRFEDFVRLLEAFGFVLRRTKGSHRIYRHPDIPRPFPVQPQKSGQAKPYQIQQLLDLIEQYQLKLLEEIDEDET